MTIVSLFMTLLSCVLWILYMKKSGDNARQVEVIDGLARECDDWKRKANEQAQIAAKANANVARFTEADERRSFAIMNYLEEADKSLRSALADLGRVKAQVRG